MVVLSAGEGRSPPGSYVSIYSQLWFASFIDINPKIWAVAPETQQREEEDSIISIYVIATSFTDTRKHYINETTSLVECETSTAY